MKTDGHGTTFTHDGRNRLIKAVKADGTTMVYGYSPSGLRVERVKNPTGVNVAGLPTGGDGVRYLLSGSEEIADLDRERNVIRRYIPGAAIDERVAQLDAAGNVVFIHNDRQNSVIAISNILGAVIQKRAYGTYGETDADQMRLQPNATTIHPFGYTGRRWDPDLGLYYYRARWYDPQLGTFLETDPIGALDYVNLYSYVGLEPGNGVDPTGMEAACVTLQNCGRAATTPAEQRAAAITLGAMAAAPVAAAVAEATSLTLVGAAGLRASQAAVGAAAAGRAASNGQLTGPQATAITRVQNVLSNNSFFKDFLGVLREVRGQSTGFDHITEMRNSVVALGRSINTLKGSLQNPNLSPAAQRVLENQLRVAERNRDAMQRTLRSGSNSQ
jgi:RHS repeat-associated protein